MSKFYSYRQNNSGGSFHADAKAGISVEVVIEANSQEQANQRAQDKGLYFDGCYSGQDCSCCGDRWYDYPIELEVAPSHAGGWSPWVEGKKPAAEGYIHYLNGDIVALPFRRDMK